MLKILLFNEFIAEKIHILEIDKKNLYYSTLWGPLHVLNKDTLEFRALFIDREDHFYVYYIDDDYIYFYHDDKIHVIDKESYRKIGICEKIITKELIKSRKKFEKDKKFDYVMFKRVCTSDDDFFYICMTYEQAIVIFDKNYWQEVYVIKLEGWNPHDIYADDNYLYILESSSNKSLRIFTKNPWNEIKQINPATYNFYNRFDSISLDEQYIYLLGEIENEKQYPTYQAAIVVLKKGTWEKVFEVKHRSINFMYVNNEHLYLIINNNIVEVWDTIEWNKIGSIIDKEEQFQKIAIDDDFMYSTSSNGTIKKWNLTTKKIEKILSSKTRDIKSVAIDDDYIYIASEIGSVRIWNRKTLHTEDILREDKNPIRVFIRDNYLFGAGNIVHVWERGSWLKVQEIELVLSKIAFDENFVYYSDYGHYVKVADPKTFESFKILHHSDWVEVIEVDDKFVYSADKHVLSIWDKKTWKQQKIIEVPTDQKIIDVLQDNEYLYLFTDGKIAQIWKKKIWKKVDEREIDRFDMNFTLYGKFVFCSNVSTNGLKIRDKSSWEIIKEFIGFGESITYRLYKDILVIATINGIVGVYTLRDYSLKYVFYNNSDFSMNLLKTLENSLDHLELVGDSLIATIKDDKIESKDIISKIINNKIIPVKDHEYGLIYDKNAIGN